MTENKNGTGITLCELKERIYKTLGEYSANGVEINDSEYEKSDLEKKILMCINTAVTKASMHLPVYTLIKDVYFPEIKYAFTKQNVALPEKGRLVVETDTKCARNAFVVKCSGSFSVYQGENVLYETSSDRSMEITKHAFTFDASDDGFVTFVSKEGGVYIDTLYTASGTFFDVIDSAEHFPDFGTTFAKMDGNISEITYAEKDGKSIPVYKYTVKDSYVYTDELNSGKSSLHYTPVLNVFTEESDEDEILLLPEITVCGVVYLAASELCELSDTQAFNALTYKYRDIALNCYDRQKEYHRNSFYDTSVRKIIGKGV